MSNSMEAITDTIVMMIQSKAISPDAARSACQRIIGAADDMDVMLSYFEKWRNLAEYTSSSFVRRDKHGRAVFASSLPNLAEAVKTLGYVPEVFEYDDDEDDAPESDTLSFRFDDGGEYAAESIDILTSRPHEWTLEFGDCEYITPEMAVLQEIGVTQP